MDKLPKIFLWVIAVLLFISVGGCSSTGVLLLLVLLAVVSLMIPDEDKSDDK